MLSSTPGLVRLARLASLPPLRSLSTRGGVLPGGPPRRGPPGMQPGPGRGGGPPGGPPAPGAAPPRPQGIIGADDIKRQQAFAEAKRAAASAAASAAAAASASAGARGAGPSPPSAAADDAAIFDVTPENFQRLVLQSPVAVILDCWATWCEPCTRLTPKLEAVVKASRGALRLAKLNVDEQQQLAAQLQVRSLPTVIGIVSGKSVDAFQGLPPDERLGAFMEKLITAAEKAGVVPASAAAPTNAIEAAEDAVMDAHRQLDAGAFETTLRDIPPALAELQAVEATFRVRAEAEAAAAGGAAASAAPSLPSGGSSSSSSGGGEPRAKGRKITPPNPVPQPIQDLTARALAALVRANVAAGQKAGAGALSGGGGAGGGTSDVAALYSRATGYATLLREGYKGSANLPEVQRALAAADLAAGAASALPSLAPVLDAVKRSPNDPVARLRLAEAQLGLGQSEEAVESALEALKMAGPAPAAAAAPAAAPEAGAIPPPPPAHKEAARSFLLKVFETLGPAHPVTVSGRKRLTRALFR
jgi:thioredoxin